MAVRELNGAQNRRGCQTARARACAIVVGALTAMTVACGGSPTGPDPVGDPTQTTPTAPSAYNGRCVDVQGTVTVAARAVSFQVWDDATVDGDIVSLVVNGVVVLNQVALDGPANRRTVPVTLRNQGYNDIILYAHNEGSIPPNTAALSINDGATTQQLVMSANLSTNGAYNIVVGSAPPPPARTPCPTTTAPPTPTTVSMRWVLTDACNDGLGMRARFFDKTNSLVWPTATTVYTSPSGGTVDVALSATRGANVCYGAEKSPADNTYWGVGIDGTRGCTDCCYTAADTTVRLNLTCSR